MKESRCKILPSLLLEAVAKLKIVFKWAVMLCLIPFWRVKTKTTENLSKLYAAISGEFSRFYLIFKHLKTAYFPNYFYRRDLCTTVASDPTTRSTERSTLKALGHIRMASTGNAVFGWRSRLCRGL